MTYLYPPLAYHLFIPYIAVASALGEIPLELWLIVMGVNVQHPCLRFAEHLAVCNAKLGAERFATPFS